jgi:uncharacterized protein Usg
VGCCILASLLAGMMALELALERNILSSFVWEEYILASELPLCVLGVVDRCELVDVQHK